VVLFREHRHAQGERVHAREHAAAGPEHSRDLAGERLRGQVPGQRAVLGYHAIGTAVGEELKPARLGGDRAEPPPGSRVDDGRRHPGFHHAQHRVAGAGGDLGGVPRRPRDVHKERCLPGGTSQLRQPRGELRA